MTEPLTFRLRHMFACACKEPAEAADRIEKLEDTIEVMQHQLKELQWSFDCKDDLHKQDYARMKKYLERIEKLETALQAVILYAENADDDYLADQASKALNAE